MNAKTNKGKETLKDIKIKKSQEVEDDDMVFTLDESKSSKSSIPHVDIRTKEMVNVGALLQVSMGVLYLCLSSLGYYIIIRFDVDKPPEVNVPDPKSLLSLALEGITMIMVGLITLFGLIKNQKHFIVFSIITSPLILSFSILRFLYHLNLPHPHNEIYGLGLLMIINAILFFIYTLCLIKYFKQSSF